MDKVSFLFVMIGPLLIGRVTLIIVTGLIGPRFLLLVRTLMSAGSFSKNLLMKVINSLFLK